MDVHEEPALDVLGGKPTEAGQRGIHINRHILATDIANRKKKKNCTCNLLHLVKDDTCGL